MELWLENGWSGNGRWRDAVDRLFNETERGFEQIVPAADVVEDADGYHFHFEMPGLKREAIDVQVEDGSLVIETERKAPEWPKDTAIHRAERRYGHIRRSFRLPEDANHQDVRASYRDGVLEVTVGKRPEAKPVKVKVEYEN